MGTIMLQPHAFWQQIEPPGTFTDGPDYDDGYPATLADGREILLPIRPLADGEHALASLIINQASFAVQDALAQSLATMLAEHRPDVIVGLPTLGLTLASAVARILGHHRYVPLGTSRKFWYRDDLSMPLSSVTTPEQAKRLYIDPRMVPLLEGQRVALVDDVISSGASIAAGLNLLALCDIRPVVIGAAMLQSDRWRETLQKEAPATLRQITGVFKTPMLIKTTGGRWRRPA